MSQGYIGEKLGSFRLEEILGAGAMGVVFRATHESSGRPAAVKIVHTELSQKGKVFERFEREAEILKQFRHPNIVRWLAWGRFKGTSYFAMEYVEGVTLERVVQERGELPWREVVDLGIQLCDALHYAHEMSVVHRDLKPSNLLIATDGRLKLTDFGIAKDLDRTTQLTAPGRTLGTAAYMAPEQIRGTPAVSHKTDLYALGVLLYQMLTGKPPFEGASAVVLMHCHLNQAPPRPSACVQEIPKDLDDLVVMLMAKSPADRPWDAAVVEATLKELKDKAQAGQEIAMVWPEPGSPQANPTRAGVGAPPARARKKSRKSGSFGGFSSGFAGSDGGGLLSRLPSRAAIETFSLVGALALIGGFIAYWLWPPSALYLYRQAESLMSSSHRSDWITARDEYFDTLDRKHPSHPYKEQLQKWRDQILLDEAEGRARNLSSKVQTQFSEPHTNAERQYVSFDILATKASDAGDEVGAVNYWREMARVLKPDNPDERSWHLLANRRAEELESKIKERRTFVTDQLSRAEEADRTGRPNEATTIRTMLRDKYLRYTDMKDLLRAEPAANPDSGTPPGATQPASRIGETQPPGQDREPPEGASGAEKPPHRPDGGA
jgi:serine/threonine-protein kinase